MLMFFIFETNLIDLISLKLSKKKHPLLRNETLLIRLKKVL